MARNPTVVTSNPGATARREPSSQPCVASPPPPPRRAREAASAAASAAAEDDAEDDARIAPRSARAASRTARPRARVTKHKTTFSPRNANRRRHTIAPRKTTMATTTTTTVGDARAHRTPHGGARFGFARHAQTRAPHITRTRARIDSKDPWWEKPCPENMKECESTMEFLNLLVRASHRWLFLCSSSSRRRRA